MELLCCFDQYHLQVICTAKMTDNRMGMYVNYSSCDYARGKADVVLYCFSVGQNEVTHLSLSCTAKDFLSL